MGKFFLLLGAAFALTMLAATVAFAGQGNGKPDAPGAQAAEASHGNAYGRDKDHGQAESPDQDQGGSQGKPDGSQSSGEAQDEAHGHAGGGNGHVGESGTKGKSDEAQHHVILCHRTGSDTNPYVVINVSVRAWEHGHATHPELDGRSDILLKDPAMPGEKMDRGLCEAGAGGGGGGGGGSGGSGGSGGGGNGGGGNVGGHVGDSGGGGNPGSARGGESGPVATEDLPFTGVPALVVLLVGIALAAAGLVLRRKPALY